MIRFATIGTGEIVRQFLSAALSHPDFVLAGVYSRDEEKAKAFSSEYHADLVFTSIDDLASSKDIDAVYIASPNISHAEQALKLMKGGKHILCAKPMATTYIDCDGMTLAAHNGRVILLEALQTLFMPSFKRLYELIPEIGTIRSITANVCHQSDGYESFLIGQRSNEFNPRLNNSSLVSSGILCIAPTIAMMGEPEKILSMVTKVNDFEGQGAALAHYPGMIAHWNWSNIANSSAPSEIIGENGSILIGDWESMSPITLCLKGQDPKPIETEKSSGFYEEIDAFIQMIQQKGGNEGYLSISLAVNRVFDEIAKQQKLTFQQTCWNPVVLRDD